MDQQATNEIVDWVWGVYIQQKEFFGFLDLPIDTLDGVKIDIARIRVDNYKLEFFIQMFNENSKINKFTGNYDCELVAQHSSLKGEFCDVRFPKHIIRGAVDRLIKVLGELTFNTRLGVFTRQPQGKLPQNAFKALSSVGAIKMKQEPECCVCYEATYTNISSCKHSVCGRCLSHFKKMCCPMCRASIAKRNNYEEEEEEENSDEEEEEE